MLKGSQALMHAIETGTPEPTNEAQRKELSAEWQRTGDAATLAKLEAVEAQHTPGPWKFRVVAKESFPVVAMLLETEQPGQPMGDPCILAVREDWFGYLTHTERGQANARLIAAAPELLEACRQAAEYLADPEHYAFRGTIRNALRAAIAKAGGGK